MCELLRICSNQEFFYQTCELEDVYALNKGDDIYMAYWYYSLGCTILGP